MTFTLRRCRQTENGPIRVGSSWQRATNPTEGREKGAVPWTPRLLRITPGKLIPGMTYLSQTALECRMNTIPTPVLSPPRHCQSGLNAIDPTSYNPNHTAACSDRPQPCIPKKSARPDGQCFPKPDLNAAPLKEMKTPSTSNPG